MLDERKANVLRAVVEEYITTAQPVGSGRVARTPGVGVSSATVRNDMATLEAEGYLRQPHTSAGRVPTDMGYRYFVDHLGPTTLPQATHAQVRDFFARAHGEMEQLLRDTSSLLSGLTSNTALVIGTPSESSVVRSVQLVGLGPQLVLAVVVSSDGSVDKHTIDLAEPVGEEVVIGASSHLATAWVGERLRDLPTVDPSGSDLIDSLVGSVEEVMNDGTTADHDSDQVFVGGASRMAAAFDAVDTVERVLTILEQQFIVITLLRDVLDRGEQVAIGAETGVEPLNECAVVVAPYEVDGEAAGTLGILGPTRMDYSNALAAVALVSQRLGRRLAAG